MPDRPDIRKNQNIVEHTLEKAYSAILTAITADDGLDGAEGEAVLSLIEDALGYNPHKVCGACGKENGKCSGH